MKKILGSVGMLALVGALVWGATGAFFSDTETSTGNTFTAGAIDLTVDNTCYYNITAENGQPNCPTQINNSETTGIDESVVTSWTATNLGAQHKFFWFNDVKPGDFGEDTISLHVDNDAWLRLVIKDVTDLDNSCTEPEGQAEMKNPDGSTSTTPGCSTNGELRESLLFSMWLDQGQTLGFQGKKSETNQTGDPGEGDNIRNFNEPTIISSGTIDPDGTAGNGVSEIWNLKDAGGLYLKGGETAYFGIDWILPGTVGNDTQTDSMSATMEFQVQQHRNNSTPIW